MGARARENQVELIVQSKEFKRRVGLISNYYDLEWLGLNGHDFCGVFGAGHLPQLISFCRENPEYHIVSCDGPGRSVNRLLFGKDFYQIASGDRNPAIVLNYLLDPKLMVSWEDAVSSALAVFDDVKNRIKR